MHKKYQVGWIIMAGLSGHFCFVTAKMHLNLSKIWPYQKNLSAHWANVLDENYIESYDQMESFPHPNDSPPRENINVWQTQNQSIHYSVKLHWPC